MGDGIENRLHRLRAPFSSSKFRAKLIGAGAENRLQFGSISARLRQLAARSRASNNTKEKRVNQGCNYDVENNRKTKGQQRELPKYIYL